MKTPFELYRTLPHRQLPTPSALTIGNFDGVHVGHQAILGQVCQAARERGLVATVMTFAPHPRTFFARRSQRTDMIPAKINTLRDKVCALKASGIDRIFIQRFDEALASMDASEFVRHFLVAGLKTRWLLVGEDFRFGHRRLGDVDLLRRMGQASGFEVHTLADVRDPAGQRISSSSLRTALAEADLDRSHALLGRHYTVSGHVIHGRALGRTLGFPTLNLRLPTHCAVRKGIYVTRVHGLTPAALPAVSSLGVRPTVTRDGALLLETHILDQAVQAYGKLVTIEFLAFLRDEKNFPDLTTLTAAIREDAQRARNYFASHGL